MTTELTKREYMATHILASYLASPLANPNFALMVAAAVRLADQLIEELSRHHEQEQEANEKRETEQKPTLGLESVYPSIPTLVPESSGLS